MRLRLVVIAVGVLALYCMALPVSLPQSAGLSSGECLTRADRPPHGSADAIELLEGCSAQLPTDVELIADIGDGLERAGDLSGAEAAYRRAITIDPDYADMRRRLSVLLLRRGARDEARTEIETALRVQPNRRVLLDLLRESAAPAVGRP
jgi:tetratricopeptide (TPR) repeat protein